MTAPMTMDLAKKFAAPVPRYTSYPTALSFASSFKAQTYEKWLADLPTRDPVSLYVHIPYCSSVCWYCGCHAKAARRPEPIQKYLDALEAEIALVKNKIPTGLVAESLHWGGGSPNSLAPADITRLANTLNKSFNLNENLQFAVEIDPRTLTRQQAAAFASAGVNRVSLGVQDFDDDVQAAIGRIQSFETTMEVAALLREHAITSLNVDLVYGLPGQTKDSAEATMDGVLALDPERIALFGYAHLPAKFKRQRLIKDDALPGIEERFTLSNLMAQRLIDAGYIRIGLDHFAKPGDTLASGPVRRNFQGYTTDAATTLIGMGATAISKLPGGYAQNTVPIPDYERTVLAGNFATVRGYEMTQADHIHAFAIERLMCDLAFPAGELRERFGDAANPLFATARNLIETETDGLIEQSGDGFRITEKGRPFMRSISARFDEHLQKQKSAYSTGV